MTKKTVTIPQIDRAALMARIKGDVVAPTAPIPAAKRVVIETKPMKCVPNPELPGAAQRHEQRKARVAESENSGKPVQKVSDALPARDKITAKAAEYRQYGFVDAAAAVEGLLTADLGSKQLEAMVRVLNWTYPRWSVVPCKP